MAEAFDFPKDEGDNILTEKPISGGLEQLVTNLKNFLFCSSESDDTMSQNCLMYGFSLE